MKKILKLIKTVLLVLWQFPQIIIGWLVLPFLKPFACVKGKDDVRYFYCDRLNGSAVTFGPLIFLSGAYYEYQGSKTEMHEYGHSVQSKWLGPLYLFVVGMPSIVHAIFHKDREGHTYYDFFTERWADKLGGVKR